MQLPSKKTLTVHFSLSFDMLKKTKKRDHYTATEMSKMSTVVPVSVVVDSAYLLAGL